MKKVLITGNKGLSLEIQDYLAKSKIDAECVDVFGDNWKNGDFSEFETIIHVAGVVPKAGIDKNDFYTVNTQKTTEIAQKAKNEGVHRFIYFSSMAVYGAAQQMSVDAGTVTESTACVPDTDYGKSKLLAEKYLIELTDESFRTAMIRVPSIFGKRRTEYLDQYKYLSEKLPVIPVCFTDLKKSVISVESLLKLLRLMVDNQTEGIVCPDDGPFSAIEFCRAIHPDKKCSRTVGKLMEIFLNKNERIRDYYGAVCYSPELSNLFDGSYRVKSLPKSVANAYEK